MGIQVYIDVTKQEKAGGILKTGEEKVGGQVEVGSTLLLSTRGLWEHRSCRWAEGTQSRTTKEFP